MIALVLMPFCDVERPSLALGLLKAALTTSGFDAQVVYANLRFARQVGVHASSLPLRLWAPALVGEWIFAGAAFPDFFPADDRYLDLRNALDQCQSQSDITRLVHDLSKAQKQDATLVAIIRAREAELKPGA